MAELFWRQLGPVGLVKDRIEFDEGNPSFAASSRPPVDFPEPRDTEARRT
jgi:hypothetical protein